MRVALDQERCQGHGRCYSLAPEVFDSDDLGHCVILTEEIPASHEDAARSAVANCPEQALALVEPEDT
jgi:ferredoxin